MRDVIDVLATCVVMILWYQICRYVMITMMVAKYTPYVIAEAEAVKNAG